jgi:hypothetical protein
MFDQNCKRNDTFKVCVFTLHAQNIFVRVYCFCNNRRMITTIKHSHLISYTSFSIITEISEASQVVQLIVLKYGSSNSIIGH